MFRYDKKITWVAHKRARPSWWVWIIVCLQMAIFAGGVHAFENRIAVSFVMGQSESSAVEEITRIGLATKLSRKRSSVVHLGDVMGQKPLPGTELPLGSEVSLIISQGGSTDSTKEADVNATTVGPKEIILPEFTGMMLGSAEKELKRLGVGTSVINQV